MAQAPLNFSPTKIIKSSKFVSLLALSCEHINVYFSPFFSSFNLIVVSKVSEMYCLKP